MPNLPVYRVKPEDGRDGLRTLHQDHLLPIGQLLRMPREESDHRQPPKPQTRNDTREKQHTKQSHPTMEENENEEDLPDSYTESEYVRPTRRSYQTYLTDILDKRAVRDQAVVPSEEDDLRVFELKIPLMKTKVMKKWIMALKTRQLKSHRCGGKNEM